MSNTALKFAAALYDRTLPLHTGAAKPEGFELDFVLLENSGLGFPRMNNGEFDAAEYSIAEFVYRQHKGDCPFVGLPVFLSRGFRHHFILINRKSGIRTPKDLEGRRVGTPTFTIADAVWMRSVLQHEGGVDLSRLHWVASTAGFNRPMLEMVRPPRIETDQSGKTLGELLETGAIDALLTNALPAALWTNPDLGHLYPNPFELEREYYRRTKIFPILHMVVMRRELHEQHPGLARNFYQLLCRAKALGLSKMEGLGSLPYMLPFMTEQVAQFQSLFGGDPWPYGMENCRPTLDAFVRFMAEQGMIEAPRQIEEIFLPFD